jgi:hypothetical protein
VARFSAASWARRLRKKQEEAIKRAQAEARGVATQYNEKAQSWLKPFQDGKANQSLSEILAGKVNLDDMVRTSSLFKFQQETGSWDINRQLRARGLYGSGAGLETLAKFENQLLGEVGELYMGELFQLSNSGLTNDMNTGNLLVDIAMKGGLNRANAAYQEDMSIASMGARAV